MRTSPSGYTRSIVGYWRTSNQMRAKRHRLRERAHTALVLAHQAVIHPLAPIPADKHPTRPQPVADRAACRCAFGPLVRPGLCQLRHGLTLLGRSVITRHLIGPSSAGQPWDCVTQDVNGERA